MLIERVELIKVQLPMAEPYTISSGTLWERESIVVRVYSQGIIGIGESAPMPAPFYSYETPGTAWHILERFLAPMLVGQEIARPEDVEGLLQGVRGNPFAKAGLETAVWDLFGKSQGRSLAQMLGGVRDRVESGVAIGIHNSLDTLIAEVERSLAEGYCRVKIKIQPGWDLVPVREIRRRFPETPFFVDANAAYTLDDLDLFRALDEYNLMMIEQPLHYTDLIDHARLQEQISTPICLDESIHSLDDTRKALQLGSCRIVNIKIQRVGGLGPAKAIHDYCYERQVPLWVGTMPESGIGQSQGLALASLPGFTLPTDVEPSRRFFGRDIIDPEIVLGPGGTLAVPSDPGIGVRVLEEMIIQREVIG